MNSSNVTAHEIPYVKIWLLLLALLGVSLLLGNSGHVMLAASLIFGIAIVKACLVGAYYMGLKWEPRYILWILLAGVFFMLVLAAALIPDIVYRYGN
ncbi:MAG: cytochrome C oxidase subunit IV family protein [Deltaproteobacteria bacterium]|nr:cytochrome C oxidase subunit IV family protein [Deltaproteobacteria bacterium]